MEARHPTHRPRGLAYLARITLLVSTIGVVQAQTLLPGHSISLDSAASGTLPWSPARLAALGADWFLAGTVIPSGKTLVLSPGVPNRLGYIWSRYPLLTNDFEVQLKFTAKPPAERSVKDDGFAVWYVQENASEAMMNISDTHLHNQEELIANTWGTAFTSEGMDLLGYRSKFNGVGVFFANGGEHKDKATFGALSNDGQTTHSLSQTIPTSDAVPYDYRSGKEVVVKMRFRPLGIKIEIEGGPSQEIKADVRAGGYIGLSVFGGTKGKVEASERSDFIEVLGLTVNNYDQAAKGEDLPKEAPAVEPTKAPEQKADMIKEASSFKDHRAESEAIKELTNMVFKLIVESQPMRSQMMRAIETLGKRITVMEQSFEGLKGEIDKRTGHKLGEEFDAIKKELTSLSQVASTESQESKQRLESLHQDISHVHKSANSQDNIDHHLNKLKDANQRTMENLTNEHQKMFGFSIAAIAFIVIAGLALYSKFSSWEKKHIL
jgi:hypothetical protein